MKITVQNIKPVAFYLLLVMTGLFAGIHFLGIMAPIETEMSATEFAGYWQLLDGYMGQRMPVFGQALLALFILNLILLIKKWKSPVFWIIVVGLLIVLLDLAITVMYQIPINQHIQSIDIQNLTNEQISTIEELQRETIRNFKLRRIAALISFSLISCVPFLYNKTKK